MAVQIGRRITYKDKDRLHDRLNNLLIIISALATSWNVYVLRKTAFTESDHARFDCALSSFAVEMPTRDPLRAVFEGWYPSEIPIEITEKRPIEPITEYSIWAGGWPKDKLIFGMQRALPHVISSVFVEFYEAYQQWLYDKLGHPDQWPEVWRFGRAIRHSASHGGMVTFKSAKDKPVTWYGKTYSFDDNGRRTIGGDLSVGDVFVLMFEMNDELDALGCSV